MIDPIGSFERVRNLYITYLETAFRIRDNKLSAERRTLLEKPGKLCTEPLLEPIPAYESSGFGVEDFVDDAKAAECLPGFSRDEREAFSRLVLGGLIPSKKDKASPFGKRASFPLYQHQVEMLRRGVQSGAPGVVTSGTGSGKTEAFLLPIFARIAKEALRWPAQPSDYLADRWWHDTNNGRFSLHRRKETKGRPQAMRALILYPMNALVEDQLVRLRKALDSQSARDTMDEHFGGNRIFLGRYTSKTPVTGWRKHPRLKNSSRERRKLEDLQAEMIRLEKTRKAASQSPDPDAPFLFPSVDGAELANRWDIQATPPDLLVTNMSMLNAMLAREIDSPIFEKTAQWINETEDAYFYLVLDELHLQRGSSGTEVMYLLRLLLDRLGLLRKGNRHKLRILCSSASLPATGLEGDDSVSYLWDAFGRNGLAALNSENVGHKEQWRDAIIPGKTAKEKSTISCPVDGAPFIAFLDRCLTEDVVTQIPEPSNCEQEWDDIAISLGCDGDTDMGGKVAACIEMCGRLLVQACDSNDVPKATVASKIAERIFGDSERINASRALRGMLVIRGAGDVFSTWYPSRTLPNNTPRFRAHFFFRAIDGLFAPVDPNLGVETAFQSDCRNVGRLDIERGVAFTQSSKDDRKSRNVELLYCECCGELFYGGMRGEADGVVELLPNQPDIETLPDTAAGDYFEALSHRDFAVFWPKRSTGAAAEVSSDWKHRSIDPRTALISNSARQTAPFLRAPVDSGTGIEGYLYEPTVSKRDSSVPGSSVPSQCPACGSSYEHRLRGRKSPIRNFRAGFSKSTQLLASESFALQSLSSKSPKLVSFSDSRQDAARAALNIQRRHHEDILRETIIVELRKQQAAKVEKLVQARETEAKWRQVIEKMPDFSDARQKLNETQKAIRILEDPAVPISSILEKLDPPPTGDTPARPLIAHLAALGIHPSDPKGVSRLGKGKDRFDWHELLTHESSTPHWRNDGSIDARIQLTRELTRQVTGTLFNKTYFSIEEAGLGYATFPSSGERDVDEGDAALLRTLADGYGFLHSPWEREGDKSTSKSWFNVGDIGNNKPIKKYAESVWPSGWEQQLEAFFARMLKAGHKGGLIDTSEILVRLSEPGEPYFRCGNCGRVHLHLGHKRCTRCYAPLPQTPSDTVSNLRRDSYLAMKVERNDRAERLRCEELTGQTENPSERQRKFKNIIIADDDFDHGPPKTQEIDLLAVTTTMEVGVDIGALQGVFQANMPPQRFNYQQRVGRAGRRGNAFSFALTMCRSKSHDLHYFRNPERITGDPPPTPFLTKDVQDPLKRFVRKAWLRKAFENLRHQCESRGADFPADALIPPDIHGEFVSTEDFCADSSEWPRRLQAELEYTLDYRNHVIEMLCEDSPQPVEEIARQLCPRMIVSDILAIPETSHQTGLAHSLAEVGMLPMYGMPTRVRDLYLGTRAKGRDHRCQWSTMDRDLDIAIHEFAPGSVLVKDKLEHLCVGLTGPLPDFLKWQESIKPHASPAGETFYIVECQCGAFRRLDVEVLRVDEDSRCNACGSDLDTKRASQCIVPNGFRTDFRRRPVDDAPIRSARHRSLHAEGTELSFANSSTNLQLCLQDTARTYRMNKGESDPESDGGFLGFTLDSGTTEIRHYGKSHKIENQLVDRNLYKWSINASPGSLSRVWFAAPKVTNSLYMAPQSFDSSLRLASVRPELDRDNPQAVRAAAYSAAFLLIEHASRELDIDPGEFEVLPPRVMSDSSGKSIPIIQIADHLVNGSGFCRRLSEARTSESLTMVESIITSMVSDTSAEPMSSYLENWHEQECDSSCYACMRRYGNQAFHALLDWRLGLTYLRCIIDADFSAGLNEKDWEAPYLQHWHQDTKELATRLTADFGGTVQSFGELVGFRFDSMPNDRWAIISHPLWSVRDDTTQSMARPVRDSLKEAARVGVHDIRLTDSFEMVRRPVRERSRLSEI